MRGLEQRDLDWIDRAPVSVVATAESSASPGAVFAVLADHERWPDWFPSVRRIEVLGPATGVGARRRVTIPGAVIDEQFIAWDPGVRWAFTGTAARPGIVRSLVEDCRLEATPTGGTAISYGMHFAPAPLATPFARLARRGLGKNLQRAMRQLATRSEGPPS